MDDKHIPTPDMQPDLDDVQQIEPAEYTAIPVTVCGPLEARELPSKRIAARTVAVSTAAGTKLLSVDPRRKSATIIARTQDIRIGSNQSQAQLNGAWVPGSLPFVLATESEVWAVGDGADTDVSVVEEYWA